MADYLAPFHMPDMPDAKFQEQKAAYVKEHGYSITLPRFSDIVHVGLHKPMTPQEKTLWYSGQKDRIGRSRQIELYYQKERSRERYKKMLASPIPSIISSITSVLTAIDDAQDAIISLAALGRIACFFLPRVIVGFLAWPIGLLWFLAAIMGLLIAPSACFLNPMSCKRYMRMRLAMRANTLKGKSRTVGKRLRAGASYELARLKAGVRGYASSGSFMPSFAEGIQMLQVTDSIFGVGVSIGPIFGAAYDLASGGIRWLKGENVSFKNAPSDVEVYRKAADTMNNYARWKRPTTKMTRSQFTAWKAKKVASGTWGIKSQQHDAIYQSRRIMEFGYGIKRRTDWQMETALYANAETTWQGTQICLDHWDPVLNIEGAEHIEIEAYNEPNPLVEEMLREEGVDPFTRYGWPTLGKRWASYEELQTSIEPVATGNIKYLTENCPDMALKAISEMSATASGLQAISSLIGSEWIEIQYHAAFDIAETLLDNNYSFPKNITEKQVIDFAAWTQAHEDESTRPNLRDILGYGKNSLNFEFTTNP